VSEPPADEPDTGADGPDGGSDPDPDTDSDTSDEGGEDSGGADPGAALAAAQLSNGGFEDDLVGWSVETGGCQTTPERLDLLPHEGAAYLWGGEGQSGSCLA
jgi:hypothetical protein